MKTRAAILHDMGQQWSVEDFELDSPKAGEAFLEMAAAGLCHSDEHIRNGDMSASNDVMQSYGLPSMFPMIGGHEGAGVVLEVGAGVTDQAVDEFDRDQPAGVHLVEQESCRHGVRIV